MALFERKENKEVFSSPNQKTTVFTTDERKVAILCDII